MASANFEVHTSVTISGSMSSFYVEFWFQILLSSTDIKVQCVLVLRHTDYKAYFLHKSCSNPTSGILFLRHILGKIPKFITFYRDFISLGLLFYIDFVH